MAPFQNSAKGGRVRAAGAPTAMQKSALTQETALSTASEPGGALVVVRFGISVQLAAATCAPGAKVWAVPDHRGRSRHRREARRPGGRAHTPRERAGPVETCRPPSRIARGRRRCVSLSDLMRHRSSRETRRCSNFVQAPRSQPGLPVGGRVSWSAGRHHRGLAGGRSLTGGQHQRLGLGPLVGNPQQEGDEDVVGQQRGAAVGHEGQGDAREGQ